MSTKECPASQPAGAFTLQEQVSMYAGMHTDTVHTHKDVLNMPAYNHSRDIHIHTYTPTSHKTHTNKIQHNTHPHTDTDTDTHIRTPLTFPGGGNPETPLVVAMSSWELRLFNTANKVVTSYSLHQQHKSQKLI